MADVDEKALEAAARALNRARYGELPSYTELGDEDADSQAYARRLTRATITAYLAVLPSEASARERVKVLESFAEHIAKQPLSEQCHADHEAEGNDGEPDFEGAYDAIIEQARDALERARRAVLQEPSDAT
jgi:hypothetical protein